jgi:hypothetical protein
MDAKRSRAEANWVYSFASGRQNGYSGHNASRGHDVQSSRPCFRNSRHGPVVQRAGGVSPGLRQHWSGAGVPPNGYFSYAPYNCAPYGYYGPDWFVGGEFIGAGRWFHGPEHFSGHVDNRFDPHHGYRGPMPGRGDDPNNHFHGNEARDGRGHVVKHEHDARNEHRLPGGRGQERH